MAKQGSPHDEFNELRKKAEELIEEKGEKVSRVSLKNDMQGLSHELSVYHIELEMQNDELRRSMEQLEESRARYSDLYENAPVGYLTFDEKGLILGLNLTAAHIWGIERAFLLGKPFSSLIASESQDAFYFHRRDVLRSTGTRTCELLLNRSKGKELFHAQLESIATQVNGTTAIRTILADITECKELEKKTEENTVKLLTEIAERKRVEEKLRESEKKYRELVEYANSIIYRRDVRGNITFFNKFAQRFFGYTEEEIIGKNVVGTIVPEYESTGRDLKSLIGDIGRHPYRYANNLNENMRRDGERVWVAWTNKPLHDENGQVAEVLCVGNDFTERKRMKEALRESEERLRLALEATSDGLWDWNVPTGKAVF
ncbi:MAG: PAS domain S-box protein, partial [Syntrophorhabdales bacterium]